MLSRFLTQGIQQNSISGNYIGALFLQFCFMIFERMVYLNRSYKAKCALHVVVLLLTIQVVHTTTGGELHSDEVRSGGSCSGGFRPR